MIRRCKVRSLNPSSRATVAIPGWLPASRRLRIHFTCSRVELCARRSASGAFELRIQHIKQLGVVGQERPIEIARVQDGAHCVALRT